MKLQGAWLLTNRICRVANPSRDSILFFIDRADCLYVVIAAKLSILTCFILRVLYEYLEFCNII